MWKVIWTLLASQYLFFGEGGIIETHNGYILCTSVNPKFNNEILVSCKYLFFNIRQKYKTLISNIIQWKFQNSTCNYVSGYGLIGVPSYN